MNSVLDCFEKTVLQFPDKTAVSCREKKYTFFQLKNLSQRLGKRVAESGVENEPVGVIVNRGCDTAAFFLSVLYSGNFYVPLDPDMPKGKLSEILKDTNVRIVLCSEDNLPLIREIAFQGQILTLKDIAEQPVQAPSVENDTPLYLIYTSGSTGQPKGVLKSYGAIVDFMGTYIHLFDLGSEEIIGNQTPFFFDASAKDFYLMLFTGATLEILPSELFVFPKTLIEYMNDRRVSYICWVPSALSVVTQLNTFQEVVPETLKKIFFVGETFPIKQLKKWMQALPEAQYVNLYGSTELAGVCCYYKLSAPYEEEDIPIGIPMPNCQVLLMKEDESGVGIIEPDQVGEICVAGKSLALSYFHDPVKTSQTFVEMKLPDGSTTRVLKTGDMARYDSEGNLVFVSRNDNQIKYSGHRIELGEIESVVNRFPEIMECCCLYNEKKLQISLFYVLADGCEWDRRELKHKLRDQLSDYMLPVKFFALDSMPRNANGKIDRAKLRDEYF